MMYKVLNNTDGISLFDIIEFSENKNLAIKIFNSSCEWYGERNINGVCIYNDIIYINFGGEFDDSDIKNLIENV